MSKLLSVSWSSDSLHYVFAETRKGGVIRVLNAGEKLFQSGSGDDETESTSDLLVRQLKEVATECKASRAKLILAVGRGSVDSATFTVPPSTDAELPTLVENMAQRQLTGLGDDPTIDFVSFSAGEDGSRSVSAMALASPDSKLIQRLVEASGCQTASAIVVTHPLRAFAPDVAEGDESATLIVSKGLQSAHILVIQFGSPVLSRTIRLAPGASREEEAAFIAAEIQRTVLTIGNHLENDVAISRAVLVGSLFETAALADSLEGRIDVTVSQMSAAEFVEGESAEATQGNYAPLIAALREEATGIQPAVDFLHPKKPPTQVGKRNKLLAIAAGVLFVVGGGWYYVDSLFAKVEGRIAEMKPQLDSVTEFLKETTSMRKQAAGLAKWDGSRMNWLDELRDLTIRMPSSPELTVRQFAATPAGKGYTVTFQGTSKTPEAHRAMEVGIQDKYHTTRTPSFSQIGSGKNAQWNFRTTLQIRRRPRKEYKAHQSTEPREQAEKSERSGTSSRKTKSSSSRKRKSSAEPSNKQKEATQS